MSSPLSGPDRGDGDEDEEDRSKAWLFHYTARQSDAEVRSDEIGMLVLGTYLQ